MEPLAFTTTTPFKLHQINRLPCIHNNHTNQNTPNSYILVLSMCLWSHTRKILLQWVFYSLPTINTKFNKLLYFDWLTFFSNNEHPCIHNNHTYQNTSMS